MSSTSTPSVDCGFHSPEYDLHIVNRAENLAALVADETNVLDGHHLIRDGMLV